MRRAQPEEDWRSDFSLEHEDIEKKIDDVLSQFAEGKQADPVSIVGPYGSGKTQLLFHIFKKSWRKGVPALYVGHAKAILEEFKKSGEDDLVAWINKTATRQIRLIIENKHKAVLWFPPYENKKKEIMELSKSLKKWDGRRYVLLVDELEQAYTEFLKRLPTSDMNPLRGILDGLTNSLMFWCFGLLSAYEFVGGADLRRFKDLRLPPITKTKVHEWVRKELKPISNFIWWFSYGRIGWIRKLDDEAPRKRAEWGKWVDDILVDFTDGNLKLINPIWYDLDSRNRQKGLKSVLFLNDGLEDWISLGKTSQSLRHACDCIVDVLKDRLKLKAHETRILTRRVATLLDALAVGDSRLIPLQLFVADDDFIALFDLLTDHIMAFEPASQERDRLLEVIRNPKSLQGDILGGLVEEQEHKKSFTLKPSTLKQVFASPMVNPDHLSVKELEEISQDLRVRVRLVKKVGDIEIVFLIASNPSWFKDLQKDLGMNIHEDISNLYRVFILLAPPLDMTGGKLWEISDKRLKPLIPLNKISVCHFDSTRMFSFVMKAHDYLKDLGSYHNELGDEIFQQVTKDEEKREIRRTIKELSKQLDFWLTQRADAVAGQYTESFSIGGKLLWEMESGSRLWWTSGVLKDSVEAFSYGLVMSKNLKGEEKWLETSRLLRLAYENDLIKKDREAFPFKEFLDRLFSKGGKIANRVKTRRKTLSLDAKAHKWEKLELLLKGLMEGYGVEAIDNSIHLLETKDEALPILGNCGVTEHFEASKSLVRAMMLGISSEVFKDRVVSDLKKVSKKLENSRKKIDGVLDRIQEANERLTPPLKEKSAKISDSHVANVKSNVDDVRKGLDGLVADLEKKAGLAMVGRVFHVISDRYSTLIGNEADRFSLPMSDLEVLDQYESIKDTHKALVDKINALPADFFVSFDTTKEAVAQHEEEVVKSAFDLSSVIGGYSVDLKSENFGDILSNIEAHCIQSSRSLDEFLKAIESHEDSFNSHCKRKTQIDKRLRKLMKKIMEAR